MHCINSSLHVVHLFLWITQGKQPLAALTQKAGKKNQATKYFGCSHSDAAQVKHKYVWKGIATCWALLYVSFYLVEKPLKSLDDNVHTSSAGEIKKII